jgi:adenylate cyclase class 2
MTKNEVEIEAKFFLRDLPGLEDRLRQGGAQLISERVHETNLRFDRPDGSLTRAHQVLRLRQDTRAVLTFKGPAKLDAEVAERQEIEVVVSDLGRARRLLEALGYRVSVMYEKFRTTYRLEEMEIVLDEMPYGNFCEIEAPDAEHIRTAAPRLGLDWDARISMSYLALFEQVKQNLALEAQDLSFAAFAELTILPRDLGVQYAD